MPFQLLVGGQVKSPKGGGDEGELVMRYSMMITFDGGVISNGVVVSHRIVSLL